MPSQHKIFICIAGIQLELSTPLSAAELGIEERLGEFFAADREEKPLTRISLHWRESSEPPTPRGEMIYKLATVWTMHFDGAKWYASFMCQDKKLSSQAQSVLCANLTWNELTLIEQRTGPEWQSLVDLGPGELLFRTVFLFTRGLFFHAAGMDDNGKGIVFIGHSGAGKSTQLKLWSQEPGVIAINDDRMAIRAGANRSICFGTPWCGRNGIARNHAVPLSALILLEQAQENTIEPLTHAVAAPLLAARAFLPYWDSALMQRALDNLNTIVKQVPVYRLRCRPERAVIQLVRSALQ
jgi:hypothetical protein